MIDYLLGTTTLSYPCHPLHLLHMIVVFAYLATTICVFGYAVYLVLTCKRITLIRREKSDVT